MSFLDFLEQGIKNLTPQAATHVPASNQPAPGDFAGYLKQAITNKATDVVKTVGKVGQDVANTVGKAGQAVVNYEKGNPNKVVQPFTADPKNPNNRIPNPEYVKKTTDFAGGSVSGENKFASFLVSGAKSAILDGLAKTKLPEEVTKILNGAKGLKLTPEQIQSVAPKIAQSTNPAEINQALTQAARASRPITPQVTPDVVSPVAGVPSAVSDIARSAPRTIGTPPGQVKFTGANSAAPDIATFKPKTGPTPFTNGQNQEFKNTTAKLIDQAKTFNVKPSSPVEGALTGANSAKESAKSFQWLNHLKGTQGVAADHFGTVGSDTVYKLSQGAKTVADVQEKISPVINQAEKLMKGLAKTSAGVSDVSTRVFKAAEDRANADSYLKSPKEQDLYNIFTKFLDSFKSERQARGLGTLENYSPRTAIQDALNAPDRLLGNIQSSFSTNAESAFSKERTLENNPNIDTSNIIDLMRRYGSSQAREFGYKPALDYFKANYKNVDPAYLTNPKNVRKGEEYMQTLFKQILNPEQAGSKEQLANRALAQTYKSQLAFSPRFALQNLTQRFATNTEVTSKLFGTDANTLAKSLTKSQQADLRLGATTGHNTVTSELQTLETGKAPKEFSKFDPGQNVEKGNVNDSFDRGASNAILHSQAFKDATASGLNRRDAIAKALQDPQTKDLAIRAGNVVTNQTQFGANIVTKPEWFREGGLQYLIPKKFLQQYQRFSTGMVENLVRSFSPDHARELDILRRGDPTQTNLVDYSRATKALQNATKELIGGIKAGEIQGVALKDAQSYSKQLNLAAKQLNTSIKQASDFRAGKNLKNFAKMWAAASVVQFLFSGGSNPGQSISSAAPVNLPASSKTPGNSIVNAAKGAPGLVVPAFPQNTSQIPKKLLNFVPVVGPVYNRASDISKFAKTLRGQ